MAQEEQCYGVEAARELITDPRYTVEEFIGAGAMACVYKVSERGTPNIYALKLLREKYRERQQFLDIFQTEAIHMRDLQYPNIVRFYKFVQEDQSAYILMDYVEGKPLTHYIQASRNGDGLMPLPIIVRIMAQIARAIAYLHAEGYIHRDIKPGNILLAGKDESALLTDLGIAGGLDVQDMYGGAGTPSYMPYEQQTNGAINQTVDTYAFAIMLFEMFTGRKPFIPDKGFSFKEARAAIIELHRHEPIPSIVELRPELPEKMDEIFAQALAKTPAERYLDIMDFAQDVHEVLLPFLPDELKDFNQIRPQEIIRSAQPELIEVSSAQPHIVLFGGIIAIVLITAAVIFGVWLNNQNIPTPTSIATQIIENTIALSPSDAASNTEMPTDSRTDIPPDSPTDSPAMTATPFMAGETIAPLLVDIEAIGTGFGETLNETVNAVLSLDAPFVPLRSLPNLEQFSIEVQLDEASLSNYSSYGLAFRIQDEANYLRLRVDSASSTWLLEAMSDDVVTILQQDSLATLPTRLAISANNDHYRLEIGTEIIPFISPEWTGGRTALYFELINPASAALVSLSIGFVETEEVPSLSPLSYLLADLTALQATGDASAIVQCPAFVLNYDRLDLYLEIEQSAPIAQNAQSLSAFIYSRCLVEDGAVDFNDSYSDYLAWEDGLADLVNSVGQN